jgi:putative ABC transport system permease protein
MLLGANLRLAARSLARRPLRSFLVLQGIAWAVGIAILPAAVLEGSRAAAIRRADEVGTGRIVLEAEPGTRPLTEGDAAALRAGIGGFQPFRVAPWRVLEVRLPAREPGGSGPVVHLLGTDEHGAGARSQRIERGRYLEARDLAPGAPPVAVLEPQVVEALSPGADPLGRRIPIPGLDAVEAEVVGVLAPRPLAALRTDDFGLATGHEQANRMRRMLEAFGIARTDDAWKRSDRGVHLPVRLVPREGDGVDALVVRAVPQEAPMLAEALQGAIVARGGAALARTNLAWPVLASPRLEEYFRLKDALVLACLAMGAVVIANVMLLSVMERTGEIAVRRAEGATRADVAAQFLAEAGALGVAGSALGIPLGLLLAWIRIRFVPYTLFDFAFPASTAAWAAGVGVAAALLAGVLPARRAALLDPAAALGEP